MRLQIFVLIYLTMTLSWSMRRTRRLWKEFTTVSTWRRGLSHHKKLTRKPSPFPPTGSGSSLLVEKGIYPLICNSETLRNTVLSFLLKTKQHQLFANTFDWAAVLIGCSLVTMRTRDNKNTGSKPLQLMGIWIFAFHFQKSATARSW